MMKRRGVGDADHAAMIRAFVRPSRAVERTVDVAPAEVANADVKLKSLVSAAAA
ncbi:hypothetical protein FEQ05_02672 [Burkholderia pseudomultivorans]|uniref:Uncharacterized protein n=1 Tax=Burkholderia pseudomultivorans TaxID=1207504 RepID=A0ABU2E4A2_9BURK|nr:hypothetical protein [Burkholderia pseudomultivorans]MDR8733154.1 hypothetical protein [Burkholderia pseudomultivorans]MDR8742901.1 hypothetical protein [Burkholderia pseudomultivorans]MDR8754659.1 hypothetical protein [Burkholderia pseudomultivorans]MDR8776127.1 hypothetical protein [Burkholderia pseudomultivorans]